MWKCNHQPAWDDVDLRIAYAAFVSRPAESAANCG